MAAQRTQMPGGDNLPAHFPFSTEFLDELGTLSDQPIRGKLERLRLNTIESSSMAVALLCRPSPSHLGHCQQ